MSDGQTPERVRLGERYEELKMMRSGVEDMLRDAQKFVRPNATNFDLSRQTTGSGRQEDGSKQIYDDTAVWANTMFANGLSSYLVPKASRWAYLKPQGIPSAQLKEDELLFLENLSNRVYHEFAVPQSKFYQSYHEMFQDIGSFGTSVIYIDRSKPTLLFKSCPLGDSFFDTNEEGDADTMYFRRFLRTKALIQMFPQVVNQDGFDPNATNKMHELVYSVEPSSDIRARKGGRIGAERPFKATYWVTDLNEPLATGGMSYFPYLVPRWALIAGENYGRSPAMTCLSQIRVLNKMVKELLKSAEISNAPPLVAEDDSILLPITYGSRQVLFHEPGSPAPQPLVSGSQPNLTLEMLRDYRDQVTKSFFVDQIIREQKKERQSIMEVQDERGQMLQQLGPLLSRMENEAISPSIEHTIEFLQTRRDPVFEQMPASLAGQPLEIVYTSPAAHAQYASGIADVSAFLQDITPMLQAKPELMDNIEDNNLFDMYARMRNVSRTVIRSKDDVNAIREQREEAEAQQQQAAMIPDMAGAAKDIATARSTDPEGLGSLLNM